jgi:CRP-like cAMP-binding protein
VSTTPSPKTHGPIIHKLESTFTLSEEEKAALSSLPVQITDLRRGQDIVREGDRPLRSFALLESFTCNYKVTGSGRREIVAFHVPGDMPDLQTLHLQVLDFSIATLSPCKVAFVQHEALRSLCQQHPRITMALWRETLIEASVSRE